MKQLILCLGIVLAFCVAYTTAQKTNVKSSDLKIELNELHQVILKKIDDDVESTALGFSNSEAILRDLRVAYTFKTVLDTLTGTLNIVSEATNIENLKTSVMGVNSPIEYGGSMMAIHGAYKNGETLAFVFDKNRYSTGVSQMLKTADSSQPLLRFDSLRYTNSIKQSLNGVNGANVIVIPHREVPELCQTIQFRGTKSINHTSIKGLGELRRYITAEFKKLENQVAVKNYSSQQINELISLIRAAKRSVIGSKLRSSIFNLALPASLISPSCKTTSAQISLGRIAANQTVLAAAYDSLNKNLQFEQLMTVKTVGDGIISGVQIVSKGKGQPLQKILDVSSKTFLAIDVGNLAMSKIFISKPEEIIAEKPQEMLLALPEEGTSLLLLTDTLSRVIQQTETNPTELVMIDFVDIPAGSFFMGSTKGESDERPVRRVSIARGFQIGKYEVTQGQWQAIMKTTLRQQRDKICASTYCPPNEPDYLIQSEGSNYPIYFVSWNEAQEFIRRLNAMNDGHTYRLPTEAEWEYVVRSGETTDQVGNLDSFAWYSNNSGGRPHKVGTKQPNKWGVYDMLGNVYEWVVDRYGSYRSTDLKDPKGALSGSERVLRGGCYDGLKTSIKYARRIHDSPGVNHVYYGFRLVREPVGNLVSRQPADADILATKLSQIEIEKAKIVTYLKENEEYCRNENVTITVDAIKITPNKAGFIGNCKYGGGPSILLERTPKGLKRLLSVDTGMNGYLYPEKTITKGYYDMSHSERSGEEIYVTTYRWNGNSYVAGKERRVR